MSKPKWYMTVRRQLACVCGGPDDGFGWCDDPRCPARWLVYLRSNLPRYRDYPSRFNEVVPTGLPSGDDLFVLDVDEYAHLDD